MKRSCSPLIGAAVAAALSSVAWPAAAVGMLVDVAVIDRTTGRELPVYAADGRWFVAGRPGARYEIRLRNQTGADVLAVTSVDGVNVVSGETASPSQTGYVLAPGHTFAVRGWRKDFDRVAAFDFTAIDDAYATRTGRPDNVGVIGVAVFPRKAPPPPVVRDDRLSGDAEATTRERAASAAPAPSASMRSEAAPAQKRLGTGHGRIETSVVRNVAFERDSDVPVEVIVIGYDSHANLVARGVIPQPPAVPPRDPQPFPARFVADPPPR
ncbi:MAG: hypothetical protein MUF30_01540 [Burkholderiales bacterium]|nr:hypothetical protein [Burkholderiales bacterium]